MANYKYKALCLNLSNQALAVIIFILLLIITIGAVSARSLKRLVTQTNRPPLKTFEYETKYVDGNGTLILKKTGSASYFSEDLGSGVEMDMVLIPGGSFTMGSPENEEGRFPEEGPQHVVNLSSFFMGKFEVTVRQWNAVARLPKVRFKEMTTLLYDSEHGAPYGYYDHAVKFYDCAIHIIYWEFAREFCDRLSRRTGRNYRLPTEAEWEYACRAGTTTPFSFGETITPELANYNARYRYRTSLPIGDKCVCISMPVGSSGIANGFGLYDMHGNVSEWCLDQYRRT